MLNICLQQVNKLSIFSFNSRKELTEIFQKAGKGISKGLSQIYQINILFDDTEEGKKDLKKIAEISENYKEYTLMLESNFGPLEDDLKKELIQNKIENIQLHEEVSNSELEIIANAQKEILRLEKLL